MNKNILGAGWRLDLQTDRRGNLALITGAAGVEQAMRFIIGTAPGERPMLPDFGCRIHDLLFAPSTPHTWNLAAHHVEEALIKWEPRIELIKVEAGPSPDDDSCVLVQVEYKIRQINSFYNLVYPFYLEQGEQDTRSQLEV